MSKCACPPPAGSRGSRGCCELADSCRAEESLECRRFGPEVHVALNLNRNVVAVPPVCELSSANPDSDHNLSSMAQVLYDARAVGELRLDRVRIELGPVRQQSSPQDAPFQRCYSMYLVPRARALRTLAPLRIKEFLLPPAADGRDDRHVLWAVVVPRGESNCEMNARVAQLLRTHGGGDDAALHRLVAVAAEARSAKRRNDVAREG